VNLTQLQTMTALFQSRGQCFFDVSSLRGFWQHIATDGRVWR